MSNSSNATGTRVPEPVARLAAVMAGYPATWSICGGWAVDAWLGGQTRDHGDVDLSVFDADHAALSQHLDGWQLIAHNSTVDDATVRLWDGHRLSVPSHLHARSPGDAGTLPQDGICRTEDGWWLDIQVDGASGDTWVLRAEPHIAMPLADAVRMSPWGVPATAPEALLFFKAPMARRRDWRDFVALLPHLSAPQRTWLADAIRRTDAEHPWVPALLWANERA